MDSQIIALQEKIEAHEARDLLWLFHLFSEFSLLPKPDKNLRVAIKAKWHGAFNGAYSCKMFLL